MSNATGKAKTTQPGVVADGSVCHGLCGAQPAPARPAAKRYVRWKEYERLGDYWFTVRLTDECIVHVHCQFSEDEWSVLSRFVLFCDELNSTRLRSADATLEFKIKGNVNGQIEVSNTLPHPDDIAAFLHRMRPFVLQKDSTYLLKICGLLSRRIEEPRIQARIADQKKIFMGERMRSMVRISLDDVLLNSDETLTKWLNAYEYHRDHDKRKELEDLHWLWPVDESTGLFLSLMLDKADSVSYMRWLIGRIRQGSSCGELGCECAT